MHLWSKYVINSSLCSVYLLQPGEGQQCVWLRLGNDWATGSKMYVQIAMETTVEGWTLDFNFSYPLKTLEVSVVPKE